MISVLSWWRQRRRQREEQQDDDAYRARVSRLVLEACKVWEMPCVFVDERGARIVDHPKVGAAITVAEFGWPDAIDKLEMFVHARIQEEP